MYTNVLLLCTAHRLSLNTTKAYLKFAECDEVETNMDL